MIMRNRVSRRNFVGGAAAALGYLGVKPGADLFAGEFKDVASAPFNPQEFDFDSFVRLSSNENPYNVSEAVLDAMTRAFKYANTYGDPGDDIQAAIAERDGVERENILVTAGSGEALRVIGATYLSAGKKVVGVEPSYSSVYRHASGLDADAILLPLEAEYRQNIPSMIQATKRHYRDVGLVYVVNPNNPTGLIVTQREVRQLLDGIPEDVPVLIDEAYHHFIEDPAYATAIPHVLEGRPVIVTRTFSKIYGMAGVRLGYAVATPEIIAQMRPHMTGSISVSARWGGIASLQDTEREAYVKRTNNELREKVIAELRGMGHTVIPSQTNFFMVRLTKPIAEVRDEFRSKGVLVGRNFPPMLDHLRVSVGTAEEMERFMNVWKEIFPSTISDSAG